MALMLLCVAVLLCEQAQSAVRGFVYAKLLRVHSTVSKGKVIMLMETDAQRIRSVGAQLHAVWRCPLTALGT